MRLKNLLPLVFLLASAGCSTLNQAFVDQTKVVSLTGIEISRGVQLKGISGLTPSEFMALLNGKKLIHSLKEYVLDTDHPKYPDYLPEEEIIEAPGYDQIYPPDRHSRYADDYILPKGYHYIPVKRKEDARQALGKLLPPKANAGVDLKFSYTVDFLSQPFKKGHPLLVLLRPKPAITMFDKKGQLQVHRYVNTSGFRLDIYDIDDPAEQRKITGFFLESTKKIIDKAHQEIFDPA